MPTHRYVCIPQTHAHNWKLLILENLLIPEQEGSLTQKSESFLMLAEEGATSLSTNHAVARDDKLILGNARLITQITCKMTQLNYESTQFQRNVGMRVSEWENHIEHMHTYFHINIHIRHIRRNITQQRNTDPTLQMLIQSRFCNNLSLIAWESHRAQ